MVDNLMKVTFLTDFTGLNALDTGIESITNQAVRDTMEDVVNSIRENWSEESPSIPGQPPAMVTGALDRSIKVFRQDNAGKFSTKQNAVSWTVRVESEYGAALEFGVPERNLEPRPFLRPAIEDAQNQLAEHIATRLAFVTSKFNVIRPFSAQRIYVDDEIGAMG